VPTDTSQAPHNLKSGGAQRVLFANESGLPSLIIWSRKPGSGIRKVDLLRRSSQVSRRPAGPIFLAVTCS